MEISTSIREAFFSNLGKDDATVVLEALRTEPSVSIRLNPSKPCAVPDGASPVPWNPHAYILEQRPSFTMDPLFHAGCYYVQDSSAMFPGHLFRRLVPRDGRKLRVLDLCAAPGGKTTDLAASLREIAGDNFVLVSNEVMKQRAGILCDNVSIWGDPNVVVTSVDPAAFAQLGGWFDVIVADVPCSGEGMFRKDERAVAEWSEAVVELCAQRQKRILSDVWPALREGGIFILSTCTFERSENDLSIDWICSELGAERIGNDIDASYGIRKTENGYLLLPGLVPGEGQWAGAVMKTSAAVAPARAGKARAAKTSAFVFGIPESVKEDLPVLEKLRPLHSGTLYGEMKGSTLVPDADMALSLDPYKESWPSWDVDRDMALHFLHRDSIALPDAPKGYVRITYMGHSLGFVKNLGNRCNNLHPQSRRILKQI